MAFDLLPALHTRSRNAVVCVRVARKWEYRGGTDDGPIQHVDLVLVDEKGNTLYAEIPGDLVAMKSSLVEENGIYVISRFRVSNSKRSFRSVDARYMIEFTYHTRATPPKEDTPSFPQYAYKLTPIADLKERAGDNREFLDILGLLVEVSDTYMLQLPNKPHPTLTRHIVLRDLGYTEVKISLWGERASTFTADHVIAAAEGKPIVVLLVGGLMKRFQDDYYLSANTAARWYFNPDIPETKLFLNNLQDHHVEVKLVAGPVQHNIQRCAPADLEAKTLLQLNEMDPYDYTDGGYRCTVTVDRLVPNATWWFPSCTKCSKSCVREGAAYRCNSCQSSSYRFKYKICFIATDGTGEGEMICFGDVARQIVGKPVQQLLRSNGAATSVPPDIARIVSRRFTFAVSLTQQSYYRQDKTFQVTSVITAHRQNDALPPIAPAVDGSPPHGDDDQTNNVPKSLALTDDANVSDAAVVVVDATAAEPTLAALIDTPPPSLPALDTPPLKLQKGDVSATDARSSAHRKLVLDGAAFDELQSVAEDDDQMHGLTHGTAKTATEIISGTQHAELAPPATTTQKKRPRAGRSPAHENN